MQKRDADRKGHIKTCLNDRRQSRLSKRTFGASQTKSSSAAQSHETNKEDSQTRQADANKILPIMSEKTDAHLESVSSKDEEKCESTTEGMEAESTAAPVSSATEPVGIKESDQPVNESKNEKEQKDGDANEVKDERSVPMVIGGIGTRTRRSQRKWLNRKKRTSANVEHLTECVVIDEVTCSTETMNDMNEPSHVSESLSSLTDADDGDSTPLQDEERSDTTHAEVTVDQSSGNIMSTETAATGAVKQTDEPHTNTSVCEDNAINKEMSSRDTEKHSEQRHSPLKPGPKTDRAARHSERRERSGKYVASSDRRHSRERRQTSDESQFSTHSQRKRYKPDVGHSRHDTRERSTHHSSRDVDRHERVCRYCAPYVCECHHATKRDYHSRRHPEPSTHRPVLSDLEYISSDEETVKYRDGGNHQCQLCTETFETISSFLEHLQSAQHEQVCHMHSLNTMCYKKTRLFYFFAITL